MKLKSIKDKISTNKLITREADKGKTIVIMEVHKYKQYIQEFINNFDMITLERDATKQYQKIIMNIVKSYINLNKQNKHKYYNTNPNTPNL
jgi:hypothetical protein